MRNQKTMTGPKHIYYFWPLARAERMIEPRVFTVSGIDRPSCQEQGAEVLIF